MSIKIKRSRFTKSFQELNYVDKEKIKSSFIYEVLFKDLPITEETWLKIQAKWQELQNNKTEYERVRRQSSKWKLARDKYRNSSKGKRVQLKLNRTYASKEETKITRASKEWQENRKYNRNKWDKEDRKRPERKVSSRLRSRLYYALRDVGKFKESEAYKIFGCSKEFLIKFIEKQFKANMNWENINEWQLDHIVPVKYFRDNYDLTDINIQKICFHYSNLQPMWSKHNLSKGDKVNPLFAEEKISEIKKLINA